MVEHQDLIGVKDGAQPVRHNQAGPPDINSATARWICNSASASTELVASSRTRMRGSRARARANESSCRSPTLRFRPRSPRT